MKQLLLFFILFSSAGSFGFEDRAAPDYTIRNSVKDPKLASTKSVIRFKVLSGNASNKGQVVRYSVDGKNKSVTLTKETFDITVKPGKHKFQFYLADYYEIYTEPISFLGGYRTEIDLHFRPAEQEIMLEKPVIYLYPETAQAVNVQVAPAGKLQFTYPEYKNGLSAEQAGWNVTVSPDGTISQDGKTYPYLFWDAQLWLLDSISFDPANGFIVERSQVIPFLEEKLTSIGLNDKEQTDFITYWGPRIAANDRTFVQFSWGTAADLFGKLNVSPQPENLNRLYIVWSPLDAASTLSPKPQELPVFNRSGFDVLEWGGAQISLSFLTAVR